jgi:hypothetical protein
MYKCGYSLGVVATGLWVVILGVIFAIWVTGKAGSGGYVRKGMRSIVSCIKEVLSNRIVLGSPAKHNITFTQCFSNRQCYAYNIHLR